MTEEKKRGMSCWLLGVLVVVVLGGGLIGVYGYTQGWDKVYGVYDKAMAYFGYGSLTGGTPHPTVGPGTGPVTGGTPTPGAIQPPDGGTAVPPGPTEAQPAPGPEVAQTPEEGAQPESHDGALAPGTIALQAPEAAARPTGVLKSCIGRLSQDDLIGAEQYVTPNGLAFKRGDTTGAHIVLWKALYGMRAYDEVGYKELKVSGQTAWIPVYSHIGNNRLTAIYIVMANRGDGWKLDCVVDPKKY